MLIVLLLIPIISALLVLFSGKAAKTVAFISTVLSLAFTEYLHLQLNKGAGMQMVFDTPWIAAWGMHFHVGVDGISFLLLLLTAFCFPLLVLSTFKHSYERPAWFYALTLLAQAGLVGVFISVNAFLFYFFWEMVLIPVYFLSAFWGGENRIKVTFKFFIYTVIGSFLMLTALIYLYLRIPEGQDFSINNLMALRLSHYQQGFIFFAFFAAFAIKMPIFPFHTWQAQAYNTAPLSTTMILSALMVKMAIYGFIRWMIPIAPAALEDYGNIYMIMAIIGVVYGSAMAIAQRNMVKMAAYSSLAHVGLIAAAILAFNTDGLRGAVFQMISHGICALGIFYVLDILIHKTNKREMDDLGGLAGQMPRMAVLMLIIVMSSIALPLTVGFWGEFLCLKSVFDYNKVYGVIAGLTVILGAVYMLRMYGKVMLGPKREDLSHVSDINWTDTFALCVIALMCIQLGLMPYALMDIAEPSIQLVRSTVLDRLSL